MSSRSFEDLTIYQKSRELRKKVFKMVEEFPKDEKYRLSDQIIRSTRKCPANIAQGHGRYHYQENIQYCRIARGSLSETLDHLSCAHECEYITQVQLEAYIDEINSIIRMINSYINYLQNRKKC